MSLWTDERVSRLKELLPTHSCSQIADDLGGGISRSAVIGKIFRMGLQTAQKHGQRVHTKKSIRFVPPPDYLPPQAKPVDFEHLCERICRYPIGDEVVDMKFCGAPKAQGSYCSFHYRISYDRPKTQGARPKTVWRNQFA